MDLNKQKLLRKGQSNIGEAEDRISELPDSILHYILSFLEIKDVARTSLLSRRWTPIWTSIPTLKFPCWNDFTSLSEINKFIDFVDRTLHLHDASSSIQKFSLDTHKHMKASQVHSWISSITTKYNVEKLMLSLELEGPFFIPSSLFTCKSLIKLELCVNDATHLPKIFCFPKLKTLKLNGIRFTDDCWNDHHFSNCPVLEKLVLGGCTWLGVRNFCISIPALKVLEIDNGRSDDGGLQDCALKIHAPNLLSVTYRGWVAKEYHFSSSQSLESAKILLYCNNGVQREQHIGYGAAVCRFFRGLSHVQSLDMFTETVEALSFVDNFVNILPIFHDLEELILKDVETTDKTLFSLLKAVPNLKWLIFEELPPSPRCIDDNNNEEEEEHSWDGHMLTTGSMLQHLQSVTFQWFGGNARHMRWLKLILKNAKSLRRIKLHGIFAKTKEVLMSELTSLPRASLGCKFKIKQ